MQADMDAYQAQLESTLLFQLSSSELCDWLLLCASVGFRSETGLFLAQQPLARACVARRATAQEVSISITGQRISFNSALQTIQRSLHTGPVKEDL